MALKTVLCIILLGGGLFWALFNPIIGAVTYLAIYQITPNAKWWGLPLADLGVRFSLLAGLFTVIGLFTAPHRVPKAIPWLSAWEMCAIALLAFGLLNTYVFGLEPNASSQLAFDKFWKMILFVLVLGRLASTRQNLRIILWTLVLGSLYLGYDAYTAPWRLFALGRLQGIGGPDFKTTSGFSAHMTAMLPLIGTVFLISKEWRYRALVAVSGAFTVNAVVLCRTRSAFIGLIAGVVTALMLAPRARRFRIHIVLVLGTLSALTLTDENFWDRMGTMSEPQMTETDLATAHRIAIWKASLGIMADYPYGIGVGNFSRLIGTYDYHHPRRTSHNTVIVCFVELGFHGGAVFLAMTVMGIVSLWRCSRLTRFTDDPVETKLLTYGVLVAFVTYFVTGLGTERLYCESFWWVFAMPMWLERMAMREANRRTAALTLEDKLPLMEHSPFQDKGRYEEYGPSGHCPRPSLS